MKQRVLFTLSRVSRSFDSQSVLTIDELQLPSGPRRSGSPEILTFVGPNGSGKSTLVYLLTMLDLPTAGDWRTDRTSLRFLEIETQGVPQATRDALRWRTMGLSFQNTCLLPRSSVEDNVRLPLLLNSLKVDEPFERAIFEGLRLEEMRDRAVCYLSGGERRRVSIARGLIARPEVLFFDEPTDGLDRPGMEWLQRFLSGKDAGIDYSPSTVILISHDLGFAASVGTRFYGLIERSVHTIQIEGAESPDAIAGRLLSFLTRRSLDGDAGGESVSGGAVAESRPETPATLPVSSEETLQSIAASSRRRLSGVRTAAMALARYAWSSVFSGRQNVLDSLFQTAALAAMVLASIFLLKIMVASAALRFEKLRQPYVNRIKVSSGIAGAEFTRQDLETIRDLVIPRQPPRTWLSAFVAQRVVGLDELTYPRSVRGAAGVREVLPRFQLISEGVRRRPVRGSTFTLGDPILDVVPACGLLLTPDEVTPGEELWRIFEERPRLAEIFNGVLQDHGALAEGDGIVVLSDRVAQRVFGFGCQGGNAPSESIELSEGTSRYDPVSVVVVEGTPNDFDCLLEEEFHRSLINQAGHFDAQIPYGYLHVYLNSLFEAQQVVELLEGLDNASGRFSPSREILHQMQAEESELQVMGATVVGAFLTTFGLTILALWVIFTQRFRRRSREIGILRSMGARPLDVFFTFCFEGFLIWLLSGGIALGVFFTGQHLVDRWMVELVATQERSTSAESAEGQAAAVQQRASDALAERLLPMMQVPGWALPGLFFATLTIVAVGAIGAWLMAKTPDIATSLRGETG